MEWPPEITDESTASSPTLAPSNELESLLAPLPPPIASIPLFPTSFPFGQTVADKLSLKQLTCICLLARQKCRNTAKYHHLITVTPVPGEENVSSISFNGTLLLGVRLRRVECKPPDRSYLKMCSFACQPICHLYNKRVIISHQRPRRKPTSSSCPNLPSLFICGSREEFCHERDLLALGGLEICYRENQNDCYDPAKTQLLTIGQSFLGFAWEDLRMRDDKEICIWSRIEAGE